MRDITLLANEHCTAYGLDMGVDDHSLLWNFVLLLRMFHNSELFKCGVSLCALTVKLSTVHIHG